MLGKKNNGPMIISGLAILQSVLRFAILGAIIENGWPDLEHAVSTDVQAFILGMFLLLGIGGILFTVGLMMKKEWGMRGTIGLSAVTIVFDVWAIFAVQPTALLGLMLPIVFIPYLYMSRADYTTGVRTNESIGGVRN